MTGSGCGRRSGGGCALPVTLLHGWQWWQRFATGPPPSLGGHLHAESATIHAQHHGGRGPIGGGALATAVAVILAHRLAVVGGGLPQSPCRAPDAHGTDLHTQQQLCQPRCQRIRRLGGQQRQQSRHRSTDAPRFDAQQIRPRPAFAAASWTTVAWHMRRQLSKQSPPRNRPDVLATYGPLTLGPILAP